MIQFIVSAYRAFIVFGFAIAIVLAAMMMSSGPFGLFVALGIGIAAVVATGISAVLISINDHLAAMAPKNVDTITPSNPRVGPSNPWVGGAIAVVVLLILFAALVKVSEKGDINAEATENVGADLSPANNEIPNDVDANGCSPSLAKQAGGSCN